MKELQKAKDYALKIITFRPRSEYEIKKKLKDKGYTQEIIEEVLCFLKSYDFINDEEFASLWVENRLKLKPMGPWRLKQELKEKGISQDIIVEQLENISIEQEIELALELAKKKTAKVPIKREKLITFLARRGFSRSVISRVVSQISAETLI